MKNRRKWVTDSSLSAHSVDITPKRGNEHAKSHQLHANAIGAHRFECISRSNDVIAERFDVFIHAKGMRMLSIDWITS